MLGAKSDVGWAVGAFDQGFKLPTEAVNAKPAPILIKGLNGLVDFSAGEGIGEIAIAGAGMGAGGGDRIELAGGGGAARDFGGGGGTLDVALGITAGAGVRGVGVTRLSSKDFAFSTRTFLALSLSSACFSAALAFSSASFISC